MAALAVLRKFLADSPPGDGTRIHGQLLAGKRRALASLEQRLCTEDALLSDLVSFKRTQDEIVREINFSLLKIPRMEHRLRNYRLDLDAELHQRDAQNGLQETNQRSELLQLSQTEAKKLELAQQLKAVRQRMISFQKNIKLKHGEARAAQEQQTDISLERNNKRLSKIQQLITAVDAEVLEKEQLLAIMKVCP
jgi:hypothetical protein